MINDAFAKDTSKTKEKSCHRLLHFSAIQYLHNICEADHVFGFYSRLHNESSSYFCVMITIMTYPSWVILTKEKVHLVGCMTSVFLGIRNHNFYCPRNP